MLIIFLFNIERTETQKLSNFPMIINLVNQKNKNLKHVSFTKPHAVHCYTMMPSYNIPLRNLCKR